MVLPQTKYRFIPHHSMPQVLCSKTSHNYWYWMFTQWKCLKVHKQSFLNTYITRSVGHMNVYKSHHFLKHDRRIMAARWLRLRKCTEHQLHRHDSWDIGLAWKFRRYEWVHDLILITLTWFPLQASPCLITTNLPLRWRSIHTVYLM